MGSPSESLTLRKEKLQQLLQKAEQLHARGELNASLRLYRQAEKSAYDAKTRDLIQRQIAELHDMVSFVTTADEENDASRWLEKAKDWLQENTLTLLITAISFAFVASAILLTPLVLRSLPADVSEDPAALETADLPDRYERGDTSAPTIELKGNAEGKHAGSNTAEKIKESSRVTLSVPAQFLEPYPSRYLISDQPVFYAQPNSSQPLTGLKLPLNSPLLLLGKQDKWLRIKLPDTLVAQLSAAQAPAANIAAGSELWVEKRYLSDNPYKTPAQIDAEIKAAMGGKYWELGVEGKQAPYSYSLIVDAPTAQLAFSEALAGYQSYANRQLLKLINTHSHRDLKQIEVKALSPQPNGQPEQFALSFELFGSTATGSSSELLGIKTLTLKRDKDQRYLLRQSLEGL